LNQGALSLYAGVPRRARSAAAASGGRKPTTAAGNLQWSATRQKAAVSTPLVLVPVPQWLVVGGVVGASRLGKKNCDPRTPRSLPASLQLDFMLNPPASTRGRCGTSDHQEWLVCCCRHSLIHPLGPFHSFEAGMPSMFFPQFAPHKVDCGRPQPMVFAPEEVGVTHPPCRIDRPSMVCRCENGASSSKVGLFNGAGWSLIRTPISTGARQSVAERLGQISSVLSQHAGKRKSLPQCFPSRHRSCQLRLQPSAEGTAPPRRWSFHRLVVKDLFATRFCPFQGWPKVQLFTAAIEPQQQVL